MANAKSWIVETEQEENGRWIAEVLEFPGAVACEDTREQAIAKAQARALREFADLVERAQAQTPSGLFAIL